MKERHKIVVAAYLILLRNNKVLLLRRFNTGYEDGKYSLPAGHVEKGESVLSTMVREAKEEVGLVLNKERLEVAHVMHRNSWSTSDERLDFFVICRQWEGEPKNMEPHKCDDLSWFDLDHLPDNVLPYVKKAITKSVKKDFYSEFGW